MRDEAAYDALVAAVGDPGAALAALVGEVLAVLERWRAAEKALGGRAEMNELTALTDMQAQVARLVHAGFLAEAGPTRARRYRTYLAAVVARREQLGEPGGPARDRQRAAGMADVQETWQHQVDALPSGRPPGERLRRARWMLEELRVSLWAQQLGTAHPISEQRIRKVLHACTPKCPESRAEVPRIACRGAPNSVSRCSIGGAEVAGGGRSRGPA